LAERSTTRLPDGQAGLAGVEAAAEASTQALPGAELACSWGRRAFVLLSRLWADAHLRWLVALILVGLTLRFAWVVAVNPDPLDGRWDDTVFYDGSAKGLAEGRGYLNFEQKPTAHWPIGYSGLIAPLYFVFGRNILAPKVLNVLLGAATVLAVYVLGARLFDRRVGLVAAALLALFPSQIFFSTLVMTEVFFAALVTVVVLLVVVWTLPPSPEADPPLAEKVDPPGRAAVSAPSAEGNARPAAYKLLLLGLLVGYGAITRGEGAMIILVVLLIWWLSRSGWRPFLRRSALLLAGVMLVMGPWTIRNFIVFRAPVFVSTAVGYALWQGNRADAYNPHDWGFDVKFLDEFADVPYPRKEVEMNNAETREAMDFIVHHPGTETKLLFEKVYHLYREDATGLVWIDGHGGQSSIPDTLEPKLATVANSYYFVVLGWVALTVPFWFSWRDRSRFLLPLTLLVLTVTHLAFIPEPRYHFAFIPILCVLAAQGVVTLWRRRSAMGPTDLAGRTDG
jgi:4-amino-4-deoxy-L-arabinose transferase-like glycosyltransferase